MPMKNAPNWRARAKRNSAARSVGRQSRNHERRGQIFRWNVKILSFDSFNESLQLITATNPWEDA